MANQKLCGSDLIFLRSNQKFEVVVNGIKSQSNQAVVQCSSTTYRLGGTGLGIGLMGSVGRAWVVEPHYTAAGCHQFFQYAILINCDAHSARLESKFAAPRTVQEL